MKERRDIMTVRTLLVFALYHLDRAPKRDSNPVG